MVGYNLHEREIVICHDEIRYFLNISKSQFVTKSKHVIWANWGCEGEDENGPKRQVLSEL